MNKNRNDLIKAIVLLTIVALLIAIAAFGQDKVVTPLPVDKAENSKTNVVDVTIKGKRVQFTDYQSTAYESWRFITDGKVLINDLFLSGSKTFAPATCKIVECKTFDLATNEIAKMNLKLTDEQIAQIEDLAKRQKENQSEK